MCTRSGGIASYTITVIIQCSLMYIKLMFEVARLIVLFFTYTWIACVSILINNNNGLDFLTSKVFFLNCQNYA